jgi:hypothetical protein
MIMMILIFLMIMMIYRKVWVQSSDPYPISLTLKQLQAMLNDELPMDRDCFNLVVRNIMFDDIQMVKKRRALISKHYLDIKFWVCSYIPYIFSMSTYINTNSFYHLSKHLLYNILDDY